jgi:hypothetical protein
VVPNAKRLRKRVKLDELSVYLDTMGVEPVSIGPSFEQQMEEEFESPEHQFVLSPFSFECIITHTRGNPDVAKNVFNAVAQRLRLSLDYSQVQWMMRLYVWWSNVTRKRKFAKCGRPTQPTELGMFAYVHRCAAMKLAPNRFDFQLAFAILQNRKTYTTLYRQMVNKGASPIITGQLKTIEGKLGPKATRVLKQYATALIEKELQGGDAITISDLREIKGVIQNADQFFDFSSFVATLQVPLFQAELLRSR